VERFDTVGADLYPPPAGGCLIVRDLSPLEVWVSL